MKKKQTLLWTAAAVASLTLFACVTINIYFPAEKVESVAEDIVNDIRGIKPPPERSASPATIKGIGHTIRLAFLPPVRGPVRKQPFPIQPFAP